jgi:hypothetical protein
VPDGDAFSDTVSVLLNVAAEASVAERGDHDERQANVGARQRSDVRFEVESGR